MVQRKLQLSVKWLSLRAGVYIVYLLAKKIKSAIAQTMFGAKVAVVVWGVVVVWGMVVMWGVVVVWGVVVMWTEVVM